MICSVDVNIVYVFCACHGGNQLFLNPGDHTVHEYIHDIIAYHLLGGKISTQTNNSGQMYMLTRQLSPYKRCILKMIILYLLRQNFVPELA